MSDSWNLPALRSHVESLGETKRHLLAAVESIDRYKKIFRYHVSTAIHSMDGILNEKDPYDPINLRSTLGTFLETAEFRRAEVICDANVLGCMHAARSLFDVFSHLVNELVLGGILSPRDCDLRKVIQKLAPSQLKSDLELLKDSKWFRYVSAYVNAAKHRFLVSQSTHLAFDVEFVGVRIASFEFDGDSYPEISLRELLLGVIEVKNQIIKCGNTLNSQLNVSEPSKA